MERKSTEESFRNWSPVEIPLTSTQSLNTPSIEMSDIATRPRNKFQGYDKATQSLRKKISGKDNLRMLQYRIHRPGRHAETSSSKGTDSDKQLQSDETSIEEQHNMVATVTVLHADKKTKTYLGCKALAADSAYYVKKMEMKEFFWVDVMSPHVDDLAIMEHMFKIHPLTSEDIFELLARDKVESFEKYMFVALQTKPAMEAFLWSKPISIYICVFDSFILTFHAKPVRPIENALGELCHRNKPLQPDWVLYSILDTVIDAIEPEVKVLEEEVDTIDEMIFSLGTNDQKDAFRRMDNASKYLANLLQRLKNKRNILVDLSGIGRVTPVCIREATMLYFRDVLDHTRQLITKIEASRTVIFGTQSSYMAKINMDLTISQNRSSSALRKLALASVVFLPLTFFSTVFGMNITVPWQDGTMGLDGETAFIMLCMFDVVLACCILLWAKCVKLI